MPRTSGSRWSRDSTRRERGSSPRGQPDVAVAILDTGIKWNSNSLRTQVRLNRGELPAPENDGTPGPDVSSCGAFTHAGYDLNGDGAFNVLDYACDSRVSPTAGPHGSAKLDPEDLIATFSNGTDQDSNGFVDDIAGWDFFDNDNDAYDASSYFAASNHGSGRASNAAERGNDADGALGVCPQCQLIPIRTWDTFVSDGNTFGMGILFATDSGASVIEGANGSIYHSAFAEAASNYAYDQGVVQTFSGDDLNTGNHNYPANYGHTMLIQGTVPDTVGLGMGRGFAVRPGVGRPVFGLHSAGAPGSDAAADWLSRDQPAGPDLLPGREHDSIWRQKLDLDGGYDRLGEHRQGRWSRGARDQRRGGQEHRPPP